MTQNTTNGVDVRAADVFKSVTSNLNELKHVEFEWKNNVTRLNQTNLNLLNEGINTALTSIEGLTGATSTALDTLNDELTTLKGNTDTNASRITAIETTLNGDGKTEGLVTKINNHYQIYQDKQIAREGNFKIALSSGSTLTVENDLSVKKALSVTGATNLSSLSLTGSITLPTATDKPILSQGDYTIKTLETLSSLSNMAIKNEYTQTNLENHTYSDEETYDKYIPTVYFVQSALDRYFEYLNNNIEWFKNKIYIDTINTATSVISHSQEVDNSNVIVFTPKRISNLNKVHIDLDLVTDETQDTVITLTLNNDNNLQYTLGDALHAGRILGDLDCLSTFLKFNFNEINKGCAPISDSPLNVLNITSISLSTNTQVSGKCVVTEYYDLPQDTDIINMEDILDE